MDLFSKPLGTGNDQIGWLKSGSLVFQLSRQVIEKPLKLPIRVMGLAAQIIQCDADADQRGRL